MTNTHGMSVDLFSFSLAVVHECCYYERYDAEHVGETIVRTLNAPIYSGRSTRELCCRSSGAS